MKHKSLFLIPLAMSLILAACGNEKKQDNSSADVPASSSVVVVPHPATGVTITEGAAATVKVGKTLTLHATVSPENADDKTITWSSANPEIATVADGVVTAVAVGEAKITAASVVEGVKAEITIKVIEPSISISGGDSVHMGQTLQLTAATENVEEAVVWSSSAEAVATVDANGKVTPVAAGKAVIKAAVEGKEATKEITVIQTVVAIAGDDSVKLGADLQLTANIENALGAAVWSSSNEAVATVDQTGKVTPVAAGETTIKVVVDGVEATKAVTVVTPKLEATKLGLPTSYKASVAHTYVRDVVRAGTINDPRSFLPEAERGNGVYIKEAEISSSGIFYRFSVATAGVYRFYSVTSAGDTKIGEMYAYNEDGSRQTATLTGFTANDDYDATKFPDAPNFCGNIRDFYTEVEMAVGDYVCMVREFNNNREDMVFHIELKTDATVVPVGPSAQETITDNYSFTRIQDVGYYSESSNDGVVIKDGKVFAFSYNEKEAEYISSHDEITDADARRTTFAELAEEGVATFVSVVEGVETYDVGVADGFGARFAKLMGLEGLVKKFIIKAVSATGAIVGAKAVFNDGVEADVLVEAANDLPVVVHSYNLTDEGQFDGEGGASQDW